jgi:hypothetical protein
MVHEACGLPAADLAAGGRSLPANVYNGGFESGGSSSWQNNSM